jgi:hypothetical protein
MSTTAAATAPKPDASNNQQLAERPKAAEPQHTYAVAGDKKLAELESTAQKYGVAAICHRPRIEQALILAEGITLIRNQVRAILPKLKPLIGTPLGLRTDRDDGKKEAYSDEILVEAIAQGLLRGVYPVNNEINIIAGQCYIAKSGYRRLVLELDGLTDLNLEPGIPKVMSGGAIVSFVASFKIHGKARSISRSFPVKLFAGQGADVALGKGERKMYASLHTFLTGTEHTDSDDDDSEIKHPVGGAGNVSATPGAAQSKSQEVADRIRNQGGNAHQSGPGAAGEAGNGAATPGNENGRAGGAHSSDEVLFPTTSETGS